jgi:hypothetical protein
MTLTPAQIEQRLQDIEQDMGLRANEYEQAAEDVARCLRAWEKRFAFARVKATGSDADARKAAAFVAAFEPDDLFERLSDAEGRHNAQKVAMRTLENRATIGMALLKSAGRS